MDGMDCMDEMDEGNARWVKREGFKGCLVYDIMNSEKGRKKRQGRRGTSRICGTKTYTDRHGQNTDESGRGRSHGGPLCIFGYAFFIFHRRVAASDVVAAAHLLAILPARDMGEKRVSRERSL